MSNGSPRIHISHNRDKELHVTFSGRLDSMTIGPLWEQMRSALGGTPPKSIEADLSKVDFCDVNGLALLVRLRETQTKSGGVFRLIGSTPQIEELWSLFPEENFEREPPKPGSLSGIEEIGKFAKDIKDDVVEIISFMGELTVESVKAFATPHKIRWNDVFLTIEKGGVEAVPIITLLGFLIGLILAFQSLIPLRQFGAEIFVADLVAISLLRELGPLMTAIILAGRSGSAFAAELGTMKVNEEINALRTMGLSPVRFLVVSRMIAGVFVMPLLTMFMHLMGLAGCAMVMLLEGFTWTAFYAEVLYAVTTTDLIGGLFKSLVFGILVAGIGCFRGLETAAGPSAVGESTTNSVVSGIVLIILADGVFSVVYFYLGI